MTPRARWSDGCTFTPGVTFNMTPGPAGPGYGVNANPNMLATQAGGMGGGAGVSQSPERYTSSKGDWHGPPPQKGFKAYARVKAENRRARHGTIEHEEREPNTLCFSDFCFGVELKWDVGAGAVSTARTRGRSCALSG